MQLALSAPSVPPPILVWDELSGNSRLGFKTKNQSWNPGPNTVNSTTAIGLQAGLLLKGFGQSHSARYYNAVTGRFMSRDPDDHSSRDPNQLHKYLYAGGDPINEIDPLGRDDLEEYEWEHEDQLYEQTRILQFSWKLEREYKLLNCLVQALLALEGGATDPFSIITARLRCAAILGLN